MATVHIATTRSRDIQALGTAGQGATEAWSALRGLLAQRLGPAHAALLAEPVTNPAQGETDWYADISAAARPLQILPPPEQDAARQEMARLANDTLALAETMRASGQESDRFLAAMLEFAMQVPDDSFVYVSGRQPILTAWGHAKAGPANDRVFLGGQRRTATRPMAILPPPAPPPPPVRRYGPALTAALLVALLLLAASLYTVLRDPFRWYAVAEPSCEPPSGDMALRSEIETAANRESDLRLQLAQLSTDAGARRLQCPPIQVAAPPPPPPPPRSQDETRAQQRGAQRGKLTIILAWDDRNDLDLFVRCPGGETIFYRHRIACGGNLDVDANSNVRTADVEPVENVFFAAPQPGTYQVIVDPYAMRVSRATPFRVTIQQEGQPDRIINGVAENGAHLQHVATVTVEAPP